MQATEKTTRAKQVMSRCQKLATFSEETGSIRRTFLSAPMHGCYQEITRWMEPLGVQVHIDAAGNLRGVYAAAGLDRPRLLIGSHLDTVPNAGAYDGILGVVLAVALLQDLRGRRLPFDIEVVGFSEEEGVRFGAPFIGSRALAGRLDREILERRDARGISVRQAIADFGLKPNEISNAELPNNTLGYLEFHIEQGPVLESMGLPLAAVEAIAGQTRMEVVFTGSANHAGTTPMALRRDAISGAAEWISLAEHLANNTEGLVATVGKIEAKPGASNVIAGEVRLTLDVRHRFDGVRTKSVTELIRLAQEVAGRRGLSVQENSLLSQSTVAMDPFLTNEIERAIEEAGCKPHRMVSGAGHDAMIVAEKVPSAMIFVRTPGGISHDPAEVVATEDVEKAIKCGLHLLDRLASSPEFYQRMDRA